MEESNRKNLDEKIQLILRQTNYSELEARDLLEKNDNDPIKVVKLYFGIGEKKKELKTVNQEIYKQLRFKLDESMKDYNKKKDIQNGNGY